MPYALPRVSPLLFALPHPPPAPPALRAVFVLVMVAMAFVRSRRR